MSGKFETAAVLLKHHSNYKNNDVDYYRVVQSLEQINLAIARNRISTDELIKIQKVNYN